MFGKPKKVWANFSNGNFNPVAFTPAFVIAFGSALVGSLFASDAWNNVTFAAAEVHLNTPCLFIGAGITDSGANCGVIRKIFVSLPYGTCQGAERLGDKLLKFRHL